MTLTEFLRDQVTLRWHRHKQCVIFPALYGHNLNGYTACVKCGERDVTGPDRYSPYAWPWISEGTAPPLSRWKWRQ